MSQTEDSPTDSVNYVDMLPNQIEVKENINQKMGARKGLSKSMVEGICLGKNNTYDRQVDNKWMKKAGKPIVVQAQMH